jgi:hypothetical protein
VDDRKQESKKHVVEGDWSKLNDTVYEADPVLFKKNKSNVEELAN